jgi:peptide/nickel transport system substrate-binding protein
MIFLKRRRLLVWLLRAYVKKWRKTIFLSFLIGLIVFFILRFGVSYFTPFFPFSNQKSVGLVGAYSVDNLPPQVVSKISRGLTSVDEDQNIKGDIAKSWEVRDKGKSYIFHLKDDVYFNDGEKLTSKDITYNFLDVSVERPNDTTVVFNLKNIYSPFLVTVSRPVFKNGFVGVGDYSVDSIKLNGDFVQNLTLVSTNKSKDKLTYQFYPTEDALKTAYVLGDVTQIEGIKDPTYKDKDLVSFPNTEVVKSIDHAHLVTLFYNTQDKFLSDKRLREALAYTMPDVFTEGERNYGPFSPKSWVSQEGLTEYSQDFDHARLLLKQSEASGSATLSVEISSLPQYLRIADTIKKELSNVGIKATIKKVDSVPQTFQIFLGDFNVPKDPDQYTLWHSSQENNITFYKNLRIDKLLEDGRQIVDLEERKKLYSDFQKYLLDDPPAVFLYFPYSYTVRRK